MSKPIALAINGQLYQKEMELNETVTIGSNPKDCIPIMTLAPSQFKITLSEAGFLVKDNSSGNISGLYRPGTFIPDEMFLLYLGEESTSATAPIPIPYNSTLKIGRTDANDVVLNYPFISRKHLEIINDSGNLFAKDSSTNGTYLNGRRINGYARLSEGDTISIFTIQIKVIDGELHFDNVGNNLAFGNNQPTVHKPAGRLEYPIHHPSPVLSAPLPDETIVLEPAPQSGNPIKMNWISVLATPIGAIVVMLAMFAFSGSSGSASYSLYMLPMSLVSVIVAFISYKSQKKEMERKEANLTGKYRAYLAEKEHELKEIVSTQKKVKNEQNPSVQSCAKMDVDHNYLWSRNSYDKAFLVARLGMGTEPLCVDVQAPSKSFEKENPLEDEARNLVQKYKTVKNIPITINLRESSSLGIVGHREYVVDQVLSLLTNITAMHNYEDLKVVLIYPQNEEHIWKSLRWLPHTFDAKRNERFIADNIADAKAMLDKFVPVIQDRIKHTENTSYHHTIAKPHYLFVVADMNCLSGSQYAYYLTQNRNSVSISSIFLASHIGMLPQSCQNIVEVEYNTGIVYQTSNPKNKTKFERESVQPELLATYCHRMAPIRIESGMTSNDIPTLFSFLDAWAVDSPDKLPIRKNWKTLKPSDSMSVPLGAGAGSNVFWFDIHQKMHGVHGMFVGTNGSGKSTMIRSWILSMAVRFSPEYVNFVLVDFKGSSLLKGLESLPHIAGTISNLDDNIQRNLIALNSEIFRREKFFKENKYDDIYKAYQAGVTAFPFLFVVIDELYEFKMWATSSDDNRMALLDRLVSVGRGLGIQLIAGSQTTAPFTDIMEKNIPFRWCLQTNTEDDSRYLLKTTDAFRIQEKGRAIVKVGDNVVYQEIQSLYADLPYLSPSEKDAVPENDVRLVNLQGKRIGSNAVNNNTERTELTVVVDKLCQTAKEMNIPTPRKIWPERLPAVTYLDRLALQKNSRITAAIGLVDDPVKQAQYTMYLDFTQNGHTVIFGTTQSGKTTFIQTALLSMLTTYSPSELEVYAAGHHLALFEPFPQIQKVSTSSPYKSVVSMVYKELMNRKKGGSNGARSTIILAIDNIGEMLFENKAELIAIAQAGPGCGIYILASATSCAEVSPIELYLSHNYAFWFSESKYDYQSALKEKNIEWIPPKGAKGRGIFYNDRTLEFQIALPVRTLSDIQVIANKMIAKYGITTKALMPTVVAGEAFLGNSTKLGNPIIQDFTTNTTLLVVGDESSSTEKMLLSVTKQLANQPDVFQVVAVDFDRSMLQSIPKQVCLDSGTQFDDYLEQLKSEIISRNETLKANHEARFSKIICVVKDWDSCLKNATELSRKRLHANFIFNGHRFQIQFITALSYNALSARFNGDENNIDATKILCAGNVLLLDATAVKVPNFIEHKPKSQGNFYVSHDAIEQIDLGSE